MELGRTRRRDRAGPAIETHPGRTATAALFALAVLVCGAGCQGGGCDAGTYVARCQGEVHLYCTSDWDDNLHREDCASMDRVCLQTKTSADCVLPERLACDPAAFESCSEDGRALLTCSGFVGYVTKRDACGADEVCAAPSKDVAFCADASETGCAGAGAHCSADHLRVLVCDGSRRYSLIQERCKAPAACEEDGKGGAACSAASPR